MPASLERVRHVVEGVLADAPPTLIELKRRLAGELAIEPKAEVLQALAALSDMSDPQARLVATRAAVLHLLLETASSEVWDASDADPAALDRALAALPSLIDLARSEAAAVAAAVEGVDRMQRDAVAKIHGSLKRPEEPLVAALSVVPEVTRLVGAHRAGALVEAAPYLTSEEIDIVTAASVAAPAEGIARPDRALLDCVALRSAIENALVAWRGSGDGARLMELRAAHGVVSLRLDALRARRFERTRKGDPLLDGARRRLFTTYLALSKALAGETDAALVDVVRERILAAEKEAAAIDAEKAQATDLIKNAAERATEAPREAAAPLDMDELKRERRRKKVLTSVLVALVPIAVGVNVWLLPRKSTGPLVDPKPLNVAMPVSQAIPIGGVLYSRIATFLWDGMEDAERIRRLTDLGKIAGRHGYRSVVIVDDSRTERAYWTAAGGVVLRPPPEEEVASGHTGMRLGPVGP